MIKFEDFIQLRAFARQDGALLSLLWIASFAFMIYMPQSPFGSLLMLATPFFAGWRLIQFRNYALEGVISFRRGLAYSLHTFFYASAIFALAQCLYFVFLDNGSFMTMLSETMNAMTALYKSNGIDTTALSNDMSRLSSFSPYEWTFMFFTQNIFIGAILSLFIAAICTRRGKNTISMNNNQNQ